VQFDGPLVLDVGEIHGRAHNYYENRSSVFPSMMCCHSLEIHRIAPCIFVTPACVYLRTRVRVRVRVRVSVCPCVRVSVCPCVCAGSDP
jgi:hypothetical protein